MTATLYVRDFPGQQPPVRYDGIVYTKARIDEAPPKPTTAGYAWAAIETKTLSPAYTDAKSPPSYDFTTTLAARDPAFYRVVWIDASGAERADEPISSDRATAPLGLVAESVRSLMPMTWDKLSKASYFGRELLLTRVAAAKARVYPASVLATAETTWTTVMVEYAAKNAALELIPAGIEYWMNQKTTVSATGTNETTSFTDRQAALQKLGAWLQQEVARLVSNPDLTLALTSVSDAPDTSYPDQADMLTESPFDFPPAYRKPFDTSLLFGEGG